MSVESSTEASAQPLGPPLTMNVTCTKNDCPNRFIVITIEIPEDPDRPGKPYPHWMGIECGPCGTMLHRTGQQPAHQPAHQSA